MKPGKMATYEFEDAGSETAYTPERISEEEQASHTLFKKMRDLRGSYSYGLRFTAPDPHRFVQQAKFMEGFTDHYDGNATFEQRFPSYDEMSDTQLRTYFTWRTKVREGIVEQSCLTFVYLYACELINNIGVKDSRDGIDKLIFIWREYTKFSDVIERAMARWVKDYFICNDFDCSFQDIIAGAGLERHYPALLLNDDVAPDYTYEKLLNLSDYKFRESKFYSAENEALLANCFNKALKNLVPLLDVYGLTLSNVIAGAGTECAHWTPFKGAVYAGLPKKPKIVNISECEKYVFKTGSPDKSCDEKGHWKAYRPAGKTAGAGMMFGYLIKRLESKLRVMAGHKGGLKATKEALAKALQKTRGTAEYFHLAVLDPQFDEIIDRTADACLNGKLGERDKSEEIGKELTEAFRKNPYLRFREMRKFGEQSISEDWDWLEDRSEMDLQSRLFCRQGKMLSSMEDDFYVDIPFESDFPTYNEMTNGQLRCYLTWRTKVRSGAITVVPEAYLRLYYFELLNNIGVGDESDAMGKMADILLNYTALDKTLEKKICNWIKEYYLCGSVTRSFYSVINEVHLEAYFPNVALEFSDTFNFALYERMSTYKIQKSKFYMEETKEMIENCLQYVMDAVAKYFKERNADLQEFLVGKSLSSGWWVPFKDAIYQQTEECAGKRAVLCRNEEYVCRNGVWECAQIPEKNGARTHLVGYITKRMEEKLREVVKYKHKLSADISTAISKLSYFELHLKKILISPSLTQAIDDAVLTYAQENQAMVRSCMQEIQASAISVSKDKTEEPSAPVELKIDPEQFEKIREEAAITRERLITEDDAEIEIPALEERPREVEKSGKKPENPWQSLYSALSQIQRDAVEIILSGRAADGLPHLSKSSNVLQEVLLEGINEEALTHIGDNIIETAQGMPYVYDEYKNEAQAKFAGIKS